MRKNFFCSNPLYQILSFFLLSVFVLLATQNLSFAGTNSAPIFTAYDNQLLTDFSGSADYANSVAIQPDGKIVVVGSANINNFALARYNNDGSLDTTFAGDGKIIGPDGSLNSVALQPDGKIVVAGVASNGTNFDFVLARYNSYGSLDTSFGTGGKVLTDFTGNDDAANSVAIQPDGKIVVAGSAETGLYNYKDFRLSPLQR